jgi:hypothetical protein
VFADENTKFLNEMVMTIELSEAADGRASKLAFELETLLEAIQGIHEDALKTIADKD